MQGTTSCSNHTLHEVQTVAVTQYGSRRQAFHKLVFSGIGTINAETISLSDLQSGRLRKTMKQQRQLLHFSKWAFEPARATIDMHVTIDT